MSGVYYRYESVQSIDDEVRLYLEFYPIIRKTKCCTYIYVYGKTKRILERWNNFNNTFKNTRKKWAHSNKEDALYSFIMRKEKQIGILKCQLSFAEKSLEMAKEMDSNKGIRVYK